jgi:2-(1,2-epoxy-1,2-dihydrophenyl)acetyl-CoA isomerase
VSGGDGVVVEHLGAVARVTLDRPDVMNRFEGTMREQLRDVLLGVAGDTGVRCVLVTGAGGAFSAGADIEEMLELHDRGDTAEIRRRVELGGEIVELIRGMAKPVVAALDGVAAGAGANLALACDLRIGSERASLVESFVRIGLLPDWGGCSSLVQLVGPGRACEIMMTGERLDAPRMLELGILNRVVPSDRFADESHSYAVHLASRSPDALAAIKAAIDVARTGSLADVLAFERAAQPALFGGANCLEGMRAFVERREPRFET